jgi:small subunit ribosomal protein S16
MGRKKRPFYRLVVLDSRKRRDGAYLANLGYYNPFCDPAEIDLRGDEIIDWLQKGATVSETAKSLLRSEGVLYKYSLIKQGLAEGDVEAKMTEWKAGVEKRDAAREAAEAKKIAEAKAAAEAEAKAAAEAEAKAKAEAEAAAKAEEEAKAAAEAAEAAEAEEAAAAEGEEAAEGEAATEEAAEEAPAADEEEKS